MNNQVAKINDLQMETGASILMLSTRKSGKSYLVRNIIYYYLTKPKRKDRIQFLYLFSETAKFETSGMYSFIDPKCIFKADPQTVELVVKTLFNIQLKTKKRNNVLLVFDDIDLSARYENSISALCVRGRHYGITTIISSQIAVGTISPTIRDNITYLFWRELNKETIKRTIYPMITSDYFEGQKEFLKFVIENKKNYQFIFYSKGTEEKELKIVKGNDIPNNFKYKLKTKKKIDNDKKNKFERESFYGKPIFPKKYFDD